MPRQPRLNLPGIPQHIMQRGNNRKNCFFETENYTVYLDKLKEYSLKYNVSVHSYVLMTNHVHILCTQQDKDGISRMVQSIGRYYVRYINQSRGRTGTLWEGRFKSSLVDSEAYFLAVSRYIELNPVRANIVKDPADYPWSSYHRNALGKKIALISPHDSYLSLAKTDKTREKRYKALFDEVLPKEKIKEINEAIEKAWPLGENRFLKSIEKLTGRSIQKTQWGGDRRSADYHDQQL